MKRQIGISNLAWDPVDDESVGRLIAGLGISSVDLAPFKYVGNSRQFEVREFAKVRQKWQGFGIKIFGLQGLMFGRPELNIFGELSVRQAMMDHLERICHVANELGATRAVFGSPRNRDRTGLSEMQASDMAREFFQRLSQIAERYGIVFCLEANPRASGSNFMVQTVDALGIVRSVGTDQIALQWDTGTCFANKEPVDEIFGVAGESVGHFHISEPGLAEVGALESDHLRMAAALRAVPRTELFCIEMLTANSGRLEAIQRAIEFTKRHYV